MFVTLSGFDPVNQEYKPVGTKSQGENNPGDGFL